MINITADGNMVFIMAALLGLVTIVGAFVFFIQRHNFRQFTQGFYDSANQGIILERHGKVYLSSTAKALLGEDVQFSLNDLSEIVNFFSAAHKEKYINSITRLTNDGEILSETLDLANGHGVISIHGRRIAGSNLFNKDSHILWIEDASATEMLAEHFARIEKESYIKTAILDAMPLPVWWRDSQDLKLLGCNKAYADMLDQSKVQVINNQTELGAGAISNEGRNLAKRAVRTGYPQSESHSIIAQGKRHLLDFTEAKSISPQDRVFGYALDLTQLDDLQAQLATHIATHDEVLDDMRSAIAIFGADKRLKYHNGAFRRLFDFEKEELYGAPGYGEIVEILRKRRQLPEVADFPTYKKEQDAKFSQVLSRQEELLHLPDGRTLRQTIVPHPMGGLMFLLEDVTDRLTLQTSLNTLIAVQQATLNKLSDAVSVWGGDGKLKIWNNSFEQIWQFPEKFLEDGTHISDVVAYFFRKWILSEGIEEDNHAKNDMILQVTDRETTNYKLELADHRVIAVTLLPLPDAQMLMIHSDITDTEQVERALADRNAAFERADLLKSQFLSNISYELRTPINAIHGFASIVLEEYYGKLNERQKAHMHNIIDAGNTLTQLVTDILDLAIIQADLLKLNKQSSNLAILVTNCIEEQTDYAVERKQTLSLVKPRKKIEFQCDVERLSRALKNIVDTVISFTQGSKIEISLIELEDGVEIVIQTDWIVQYPEDRDFMRKRFMGRDPHSLRTGVGLNLSLARSLLQLHQGILEVQVESNKGFAVVLSLKSD